MTAGSSACVRRPASRSTSEILRTSRQCEGRCSTCPKACSTGLESTWRGALQVILDRGPLARRILACLDVDADADPLDEVYRELCNCLAAGRMFYGCD